MSQQRDLLAFWFAKSLLDGITTLDTDEDKNHHNGVRKTLFFATAHVLMGGDAAPTSIEEIRGITPEIVFNIAAIMMRSRAEVLQDQHVKNILCITRKAIEDYNNFTSKQTAVVAADAGNESNKRKRTD